MEAAVREPKWSDFRQFVCETMTHNRDAEVYRDPNRISTGRARSYMMDHPVWGLAARPELMSAAVKAAVEVGQLNPDMSGLALTHVDMCACGLGLASGNSWISLRKFVDLWGPKGPLAIAGDAWKRDPDFLAWWESHSA